MTYAASSDNVQASAMGALVQSVKDAPKGIPRFIPPYALDDGDRFVSDRETARLIGSCRSWPWKLARDGKFPKPIQLSARCTRWRLSDLKAWMADPQGWMASHAAV